MNSLGTRGWRPAKQGVCVPDQTLRTKHTPNKEYTRFRYHLRRCVCVCVSTAAPRWTCTMRFLPRCRDGRPSAHLPASEGVCGGVELVSFLRLVVKSARGAVLQARLSKTLGATWYPTAAWTSTGMQSVPSRVAVTVWPTLT